MIGQYELTLAHVHDADAIATLSREHVEFGLRWLYTPRVVADAIRSRTSNVVVARGRGRVVGAAIMQYRTEEAHLALLAVHPIARRLGIGSALLEWLEETARTAGIELIFLETRTTSHEARAFYRARGYRELAEMPRYYYGREDAVRIGRDLSPAPSEGGLRRA